MNKKTALVKALLDGRVLNVKNCFDTIGYSNVAREIPRMVEKEFGVEVSRVDRKGKDRYDNPSVWVDYRLNKSEHNKEGIKKMREYLAENWSPPKADPPSSVVQTKLL